MNISPLVEGRLSVFENGELRKVFERKRDEVTGDWRRLYNQEIYYFYSSSNIFRLIKSRSMLWAGHVARMGERKGAYRALVGIPEGKRPFGRRRHRWEDNIKIRFKVVGWGVMH